ncbi:group 1 glycosyl transferase [Natrialba chahannaoensis JCM 10990]|uniref:Group 1 glycosyl transferase n=1 Tax=Natrialba chahannaoensis JCM 10990 TaxID=1227492 RepID=M0AIQ4_9EURY|nr:glycosyltransferase [Natrialba chahannaoensis]ELY97283.1 group 1 glycosyl transferase [Natrialba chahannaoensis JCM 10990]
MAIDLLYIVSTLRQSGPTNQLYYLLKNLDDEFNARVLTLSPEPSDSELERFLELDVEYETLGLSRVKGGLTGPYQLRNAVDNYDPDVIHTQGIRADTLATIFLSGYSHVATIRNDAYDDYPAKYGTAQGLAMAAVHTNILKRLQYPVACSETIAAKVAERGIDAVPIQNGVDTTAYTPASDSEQSARREELGLPDDGPIVISVGSLIERKDPVTVVRGFFESELSDRGYLVMLGDGPLRDECENAVEDESRVFFEGWVENVDDYLQASDYFVSASKSEGLPNSVMEALASGLVVCLSNINPHNEILQYDNCGRTFKLYDHEDLSGKLDSLNNMNCRNSREAATNNLSASRMSQKYQQLYQRLK